MDRTVRSKSAPFTCVECGCSQTDESNCSGTLISAQKIKFFYVILPKSSTEWMQIKLNLWILFYITSFDKEVLNTILIHIVVQKKTQTPSPVMSPWINLYILPRTILIEKWHFYFPKNYLTAACFWLHIPYCKVRIISVLLTIKMIKHTWLTVTTISCQQIQDTKNYLTTAQLNKKTLSYVPLYEMHPQYQNTEILYRI